MVEVFQNKIKYIFYRVYQTLLSGKRIDYFSDLLKGLKDFEITVNGVKIKMSNPVYLLELPDLKYRLSLYELTKGDVVVDAGAYPGEFTVYASKKVGPEGKVIAFEPDPDNFQKLKENIELNELENVILINKGLWKEESRVELVLRGPSSHFETNDLAKDGKKEEVKATDLDKELNRLDIDKLNFIKMDIEGAELEALEGMEKTLKKHKPHLAIASYHIRNGEKTCERVEEILRKYGYESETPEPPFGREVVTFGYRR